MPGFTPAHSIHINFLRQWLRQNQQCCVVILHKASECRKWLSFFRIPLPFCSHLSSARDTLTPESFQCNPHPTFTCCMQNDVTRCYFPCGRHKKIYMYTLTYFAWRWIFQYPKNILHKINQLKPSQCTQFYSGCSTPTIIVL